jgi:hypothetical protein
MFKAIKYTFRKVASLSLAILDARRAFRDRKIISYTPKIADNENSLENNPSIIFYRNAEFELGLIREKNLGNDSKEEDDHLDYMVDVIYWKILSESERKYTRENKGPHYEYVIKYIK